MDQANDCTKDEAVIRRRSSVMLTNIHEYQQLPAQDYSSEYQEMERGRANSIFSSISGFSGEEIIGSYRRFFIFCSLFTIFFIGIVCGAVITRIFTCTCNPVQVQVKIFWARYMMILFQRMYGILGKLDQPQT